MPRSSLAALASKADLETSADPGRPAATEPTAGRFFAALELLPPEKTITPTTTATITSTTPAPIPSTFGEAVRAPEPPVDRTGGGFVAGT